VVVVTYFLNGSGKNLGETSVDATIFVGESGFSPKRIGQIGMGGL
jgi:hypothetical protein